MAQRGAVGGGSRLGSPETRQLEAADLLLWTHRPLVCWAASLGGGGDTSTARLAGLRPVGPSRGYRSSASPVLPQRQRTRREPRHCALPSQCNDHCTKKINVCGRPFYSWLRRPEGRARHAHRRPPPSTRSRNSMRATAGDQRKGVLGVYAPDLPPATSEPRPCRQLSRRRRLRGHRRACPPTAALPAPPPPRRRRQCRCGQTHRRAAHASRPYPTP